jgi:hypothetical protein
MPCKVVLEKIDRALKGDKGGIRWLWLRRLMAAPTFAWVLNSDKSILNVLRVGLILSLINLSVGSFHNNAASMCNILCSAIYLGLKSVTPHWLAFQQDVTIVEIGFLFALSWPWRSTHPEFRSLLLSILCTRIMLGCFLVKIGPRGSSNWLSLLAVRDHYLTQPFPTKLAFLCHQLPDAVHLFSTFAALALEGPPCLLPLLGLHGRAYAVFLWCPLLIFINAAGNFGFLGPLYAALCVGMLGDDSLLPALMHSLATWCDPPQSFSAGAGAEGDGAMLRMFIAALYVALAAPPALHAAGVRLSRTIPALAPLELAQTALARFGLCNFYGKFGKVLVARHLIQVEPRQPFQADLTLNPYLGVQ